MGLYASKGSFSTQLFEPSNPAMGDLWYDLTNNLFKSYDGTKWNVSGLTPAQTQLLFAGLI